MPSIILTAVLGIAIFSYAGWVIYKSVKRIKKGKSCCGNCGDCAYKNKHKK